MRSFSKKNLILIARMSPIVLLLTLSACDLPQSQPLPTLNPLTQKPQATLPIPPISTPTPEPTIEPTPTEFPPTPEPIFTPQPTPTSQVVLGVSNFPPEINPLTGLRVQNPELLERRPVMVKISNAARDVRPQPGVSLADIVFEYAIGYFQTRFLALYYGQNAPRAGPIRSGRLVDAQLVNMYQGFLLYGNADAQVDEILDRELGKRAIPIKFSPCPPVCGRDTHSKESLDWVFVDTAKFTEFTLSKGYDNQRPVINGLAFDENAPYSSSLAVKIGIEQGWITRSEWLYDPRAHKYLLSYEIGDKKPTFPMAPLFDPTTGQQVAFDNIVIMFASYIEYAPSLHNILIWENTTGMRAVLLRDGEITELSWYTIHPQFPIRFIYPNGTPAAFKPGKTWIVLVGESSTLEQVQPGHWEINFKIP